MLKEQNVHTILKNTEIFLKEKGLHEPRADAEVLLSFVLQVKRSKLPLIRNQQLSKPQITLYQEYVLRRSCREPAAYITGVAGFMDFEFIVNKNVLIPRPETEILVENVIKVARQENKDSVLDLCTGSGCIAVSLSKLCNFKNITASDISATALTIAKENAKLNKADNIKFIESDAFDKIMDQKFCIIVSNPPYISQEEYDNLEPELKYEPKNALVAKDNGLFFYKKIAIDSKKYLEENGIIFLELNANKADAIKRIFSNNGYKNIEIIADYANLPRILKAKNG